MGFELWAMGYQSATVRRRDGKDVCATTAKSQKLKAHSPNLMAYSPSVVWSPRFALE